MCDTDPVSPALEWQPPSRHQSKVELRTLAVGSRFSNRGMAEH